MLPPEFKFGSQDISEEVHAILLVLSPESLVNVEEYKDIEEAKPIVEHLSITDEEDNANKNYRSQTVEVSKRRRKKRGG